MNVEEMEAEIIRKVFTPSYSHAEAILHRLHHLQSQMSHDDAIEVLHAEVTDYLPGEHMV
jgi:hypothetical protein